ncbi:MAG: response regulator [Prevotella sp.]|nr:response regulator [Prevotella sp.]
MKKTITTIVWMLMIVLGGLAQESGLIHSVDVKNGLADNSVKGILRDQFGFMWFATSNGLNRYDGYRFEKYTTIPLGNMNDDIEAIYEDGSGVIWLVVSGNVYAYDYHSNRIYTDTEKRLAELGIKEKVIRLKTDDQKNLWVTTEKHIYCYDFRDKELYTIRNQTGTTILDLAVRDDVAYAMSRSGDFYQIDLHSGRLRREGHIELSNYSYWHYIYLDSRGRLWSYSAHSPQNDFYCYDTQQRTATASDVVTRLKNMVLTSLTDNGRGDIWIGTENEGIIIYNVKGEVKNILKTTHVNTLYQDTHNTMWIGTGKRGVIWQELSEPLFVNTSFDGLEDVSTITEDSQGCLWIGFDGGGLLRRDQAGHDMHFTKQNGSLPTNIITCSTTDAKGRFWAGTFGCGVLQWDGKGKFVKQPIYDINGSEILFISCITAMPDGSIWIGSIFQGLLCMGSDGSKRLLAMENSELKTGSITCLYGDAENHLYIGTSTGFYIYDTRNGKFQKRSKALESLSETLVTALYKDCHGLVWIGTRTGLIVYDGHDDRLYHITRHDGLSHPYVRSVAEDKRKRIWVSTDHGLTSINVQRVAKSNDYRFVCVPYYEEDGLQNATSGSNASCRTHRGEILMGNVKGFVTIRQDVDEPDYTPTNVVFTRPFGEDIVVEHDQNNITIEVSAMNYIRKHKIHYLYRLRGTQDEWTLLDGNRISFNALAPGHYTLEVKATDLGGWSSQPSVMKIRVRPPFWLSWPAFLFYFVLAGIAVWLYMKRLKQKHRKTLAVQTLELELQQQQQMEENKMRFFTNISHDLKTPLTLIITPLEKLLGGSLEKTQRTELELVWRNAKLLRDGVSQLLDLRRLDAGSEELHLSHGDFIEFLRKIVDNFKYYSDNRGVTMNMKINATNMEMDFDQNKMRRIVMNLLSNAFKYNTPRGNVTISVGATKEKGQAMMYLEIADTGIGIKDENKKRIFDRFYQESTDGEYIGSGIGLHIVKEYVTMHHGEIYVKDNHPQGSIFVVNIPMKQSAVHSVTENKETEESISQIAVPANNTANKVSILIVEDNQDFRLFLERCLNDQYHVLTAANGIEALKVLDNNDVNIVISDIMMPEMNGLELCNRIKTDVNYSHIPVIMLTAKSTEDNIIAGLKDGADDYITKPFNLSILKLRIQKILEWTADNHRNFAKGMEITPSEITVSSLDEELIEKAIKIVEEKMGDTEFTVEEFGVAIGMTRGHLYKKLMAITGKSPIEFIRAIRIKRGRSLLEQGRTNISEVAYTVGFSPKQFSKFFREEYGCLPSDFIKK